MEITKVIAGRKGFYKKVAIDSIAEMIKNDNKENKPPTEYEQKYVKIHEQKLFHNENVEALINYYIGMTEQEKVVIFTKSKNSGKEFTVVFIQFGFNLESNPDTNYLYLALSLSIILYIVCITIAFALKIFV